MPRARRLAAALPHPRRFRIPHGPPARRLVLAVVVLGVLGGGWLWLRDSSLVRIRSVTVTGLSSSEGADVRSALVQAASRMTTLHVRTDDLRRVVKPYASVADLHTQKDFPHGLAIEVTEREPVAIVQIAGQEVPVSAGGRLMRGVGPRRDLPLLHANRLAPGGRVTDPRALAAIRTLAAAPAVLRRRVAKIWRGPKGLTLDVRSGPELFFGGRSRVHAKWAATARVLAEPSAAGAVYLDVRIPERVAAGGLGTLPENQADPLALDSQPQPEASPTVEP